MNFQLTLRNCFGVAFWHAPIFQFLYGAKENVPRWGLFFNLGRLYMTMDTSLNPVFIMIRGRSKCHTGFSFNFIQFLPMFFIELLSKIQKRNRELGRTRANCQLVVKTEKGTLLNYHSLPFLSNYRPIPIHFFCVLHSSFPL